MQFNQSFYELIYEGATWLEQSRSKELKERLADKLSKQGFIQDGFKAPIKHRASYQLKQTDYKSQSIERYERQE